MTGEPQPQSTLQHVAAATQTVVNGLRQQPVLLALVLLNALGIGAALWFLQRLSEVSHANFQAVLKMCLQQHQP